MKFSTILLGVCTLALAAVAGSYATPARAQSFNAYLLCERGHNTATCSVDPTGMDYSWQTIDGVVIFPTQGCGDRPWCQVTCWGSASGTLQVTVTNPANGVKASDSAQVCGGGGYGGPGGGGPGGGGPGGGGPGGGDGGPGDDSEQ